MVQHNVLEKLLPSVQFMRLDGGVEATKRQEIVNKFNTDPSYDVLLLTTSVGGLGLNLTGADTVISLSTIGIHRKTFKLWTAPIVSVRRRS